MTASTYALVQNGTVVNLILWDGDADTWQAPEEQIAVLVPPDVPAAIGWVYADGVLSAPAVAPPPPPTQAEIEAENVATRNRLLDGAAKAIAPLQDAVDLDIATAAEKALLTAWKQFRVAVNRVDVKQASINWPIAPAPLSYVTLGSEGQSDA
jgi:hypothetical protein